MKNANEAFARTMKLYDNEGYFLKRKLQKVDSNALTGKGLINFLGRTNMPKEKLFELLKTLYLHQITICTTNLQKNDWCTKRF